MKVLILAYDFPPYTSMGGQRPFGWYRYLHESGIAPTVVTRHWHPQTQSKIDYCRTCGTESSTETSAYGTIVRVPYRANLRDSILVTYGPDRFAILRQLLSLWYALAQFVSFLFDNRSNIYHEADNLLSTDTYDLIIATGEPFILFRYAYLLSKKHHVPWVADYRDCWSDNYEVLQAGGLNKVIYQNYFRYFEKKYVSSAQAITTAAPVFKTELSKMFPEKDISVIYNGFDRGQEDAESAPVLPNSQLTIGFAGTIYGFQPIEFFLSGLSLFIAQYPGAHIKAVFWGADYSESQRNRIRKFIPDLDPYIETTARLDKKTLFEQMKSADMFLILDNKGMISGKLYEYLLFNKKIMMAGRDYGAMEEILKTTDAGIICAGPDEIAQSLGDCYKEWLQTGGISCNTKNLDFFSRKAQAHRFAEVLKEYV